MKITAAVTREQGQTFVIVLVKDQVLSESTPTNRDDLLAFAMSEFQMPVALLGESGNASYGDANLVRWLESIDPDSLPWREYGVFEATEAPCPKTWMGKSCLLPVGHYGPCQFTV